MDVLYYNAGCHVDYGGFLCIGREFGIENWLADTINHKLDLTAYVWLRTGCV